MIEEIISENLILYSWINFDYYNLKEVSMSEGKLIAIVDSNDSILIWKQLNDTFPLKTNNGSIVSIIMNQFHDIRKISWVLGEETLAIKELDRLVLWDPLNNNEIFSIKSVDELYFVKKIDDKYIMCTPTGRLILFNQHMMEIQPSRGDLIWTTESSIVIHPHKYSFSEGQFIRDELILNKFDRRAKRFLRGANSRKFENVFAIEKKELKQLNYGIPPHYLYQFNDSDPILVVTLENGIFVKSSNIALLIDYENRSFSKLPESLAIITEQSSSSKYYKIISPNNEYQLANVNNRLVQSNLLDIIKQDELELTNLIYCLQAESNPEIDFTHVNFHSGFIWVPDYYNNHILYDLLTNTRYFVNETQHRKFINIFVDVETNYLLEWEKGSGYPEGKLYYHGLMENQNELIYDFQKSQLIVETTNMSTIDNISQVQLIEKNPIIIPSWTKIDLYVYYKDKKFLTTMSLSSFYMMLSKWISLDSLNEIEISEKNPRGYAFIKYGNLNLIYENKSYFLEGISPIWDYRADLGLIAVSSFDENIYLWNLKEYLPVISYKIGLPYSIEISPSGRYLFTLSFGMTNMTVNEESRQFNFDFPKITISVFDVTNNKRYSRSHRFPTHLVSPKISVNLTNEDNELVVTIPSYIDKYSSIKLIFNTLKEQFQEKRENSKITFQETHSYRNKLSQIKDGNEFPVEKHPEIKREYTNHSAFIHEYSLYRKSENLIIASFLSNTIVVEQLSTEEIFFHKEKTTLDMPFYNDKMKPIYVDSQHKEQLKSLHLIKFDKVDELPIFHSQSLVYKNQNQAYLIRFSKFLENILTGNQVHTQQGISFFAEDIKPFQSVVKSLYDTIMSKLHKSK